MRIVPTTPEVSVELSDSDAVGQGAISSPECLLKPGFGATATTGGTTATGGAVTNNLVR